MKRRSFLASALAAGSLSGFPVLRTEAATSILSTAVVITDISGRSDPAPLLQFAKDLVDQGVWVTCVIQASETADDILGLERLLVSLADHANGIDIAIDAPGLGSLSPYFQSRAVFNALNRLQPVLGDKPLFAPPQSVLCEEIEKPAKPTGVRSSGLRNVLVRPRADAVVRSETWHDGVVRFFGGRLIGPQTDFAFRLSDSEAENALIYYVSAKDLSSVPPDRLAKWTSRFAGSLGRQELTAQIALMTVADLQLRDNFATTRLATVILEQTKTTTALERSAIAAFRKQLDRLNIPSAIKPEGKIFWVERDESDTALVPLVIKCDGQRPSQIAASAAVGHGFAMTFLENEGQISGMDGCAILHQSATRIDPNLSGSKTSSRLAGEQDIVLLLSAAQIATPEAQRRVLQDLQTLRGDGVTETVEIGAFAAQLHTNEPVAIRHRLTRAAMANEPFRPKTELSDAERSQLLEDARHAWGYFQHYQEHATGLCPATVDSRPGGATQRSVTMWDVGSNLNAIVAAAELGLIDRKQAETTFLRIFPNIAGRSTDGRLLPQGWIRTDRHRWGIRDFDGCDCGRLLSSLDNVRRRFGLGKVIEKLVASWDLDKILIDGTIYSVTNRELSSTFASHCAHYAALGFRRWGFDPASPYETFQNSQAGDGEMALLQRIADIGPLGTEPLLLEAMELGMSSESAYLAEVLLTAMEEEYVANNRLICVSETPIDKHPWFIYQGLELGAGPRSWRLDTVGRQPEYLTEAMADELMTFSTKAAFLWAAYQPGPFTRKLLNFARQNARDKIGFMSGINVKMQRPMAQYTDLNTNAIILQAIAHALRTPG